MGLPSPQQLDELSSKISAVKGQCNGAWPKFKGVMKTLTEVGVPTALQSGVTGLASLGGISSGLQVGASVNVLGTSVLAGTTIAPIGAALAPWIGAATVAVQAGKIFDLYDLMEDAQKQGSSSVRYTCGCGTCAKNIQYVIDKKERNVAVVATSIFTFGAVGIGKKIHSIGKWAYSKGVGEERPKEKVCKALIESGRNGCTAAMGTIFLLSGSWTFMGSRDRQTMAAAVATLVSEDGWEKLKGNW
ncbi:hypothetical protein Q8W71_13115 [Methylobacterium sp. NEAU 140]|uniref:hypothetical protein n=1 Tax=Methylobacterium sp. NEAU 140 TaxID=3064945 RepID=UPI002734CBAE|nr:hypothetical protein [Methylobacterium sp. NEAU 140]MDP4023572.1 hypothetical protein [Methylobacterium sp. NEAU 140]